MLKNITIISSIFCLLFCCIANAQDSSNIIAKVKQKYENYEKEITSMVIEQRMITITPEGDMTSDITMTRKGDKFRTETSIDLSSQRGIPKELGNMTTTMIYDGTELWVIAPFVGKQQMPMEEGVSDTATMNWWTFVSEESSLEGTETVNSRECYVLLLKKNKQAALDKLWIDKETLSLVKGQRKHQGSNMEWISSDFRKVKGDWEIPYETKMYLDGDLMMTTTTKSVEINQEVPDNAFDPDSVSQGSYDLNSILSNMKK